MVRKKIDHMLIGHRAAQSETTEICIKINEIVGIVNQLWERSEIQYASKSSFYPPKEFKTLHTSTVMMDEPKSECNHWRGVRYSKNSADLVLVMDPNELIGPLRFKHCPECGEELK